MPQLLQQHLISHHLHYTEISEVYISRAARAFGLAMIGIFIPVYLYNLGYDLVFIAVFFIIANVARLLSVSLAGYLISRFGAKHLMAFGQAWAIAFVALMFFAYVDTSVVLLAAIVWGIDLGIFWPAHHFNLSYARTKGKTSRQLGVIFTLLSIAHALGPLLGGIIATQFGIQYAFMVTAGLLLLAVYVYMQTPDHSPKVDFHWRDAWHEWRPIRRDVTANAANGFQADVAINIWPLFIFLFLGTYQTVGFVVSASLIVSIIVIYYIARRGDKGKNWQQIHIGSKGSSFVHLSRPFAQTFGAAVGVNLLGDVASYLYKIPFMSYYYDHASNAPNRLAYIMRMETAVSAGVIAGWVVILALALLLPLQGALIGTFVIAAVAVLFNSGIATAKKTPTTSGMGVETV